MKKPVSKSGLWQQRTLVKNIVKTFEAGKDMRIRLESTTIQGESPAHLYGKVWYAQALEDCKAVAEEYGYDIRHVVGACAALSPSSRWFYRGKGGRPLGNLADTEKAVRAHRDGTQDTVVLQAYGQNKRKAFAILDAPADWGTIQDILKAPKTQSFATCIIQGGKTEAVCVDGHAYNIAMGKQKPLKAVPSLRSAGRYESLEKAYKKAAELISKESGDFYSGCDVQAATWVIWRNMHGVA